MCHTNFHEKQKPDILEIKPDRHFFVYLAEKLSLKLESFVFLTDKNIAVRPKGMPFLTPIKLLTQ